MAVLSHGSLSGSSGRLRYYRYRFVVFGLVCALIASLASVIATDKPAHADTSDNFSSVPNAYWVIDQFVEYDLQIWDKSCDGGAGCYRTINSKALPTNTSETWMDTDDTGSFRIRLENGRIELFTLNQSRQDWIDGTAEDADTRVVNFAGKAGYEWDMNPNNPDVIVTYKNAAKDVYGNRSDVTINIDKFVLYEPELVKTTIPEYRRVLLSVGTTGIKYRNYVIQPADLSNSEEESRRGTDNGGTGNLSNALSDGKQYGAGTWIDTAIFIDDAKPDQSFLFTVGDLDIATGQSPKFYNPGAEGIDLGYGFDLSTLTLSASGTKLDTYGVENDRYVKYSDHGTGFVNGATSLGRYLIGSAQDENTDMSRFAVLGAANGSAFTWTSAWNCDTDMLEPTVAQQIWQPLPPVTMTPIAKKKIVGADSMSGLQFMLVPDDTKPDNLATQYPGYAPQGGAGSYNPATGEVRFPEMSFAISDDEVYNPIGTHYYKFYEVEGTDEHIDYDTTPHYLKIVIEAAHSELAAQTLGYTLKAYLDDDSEPFFTTHSAMDATYGVAKRAATGATNLDLLNHVFEWTDPATNTHYTYTYDENIGEWVRSDGLRGDPEPDATSPFDMSYGQAEVLARLGSDGFDDSLLKDTVWREGDHQYKYSAGDNVPLTFGQAQEIADKDAVQAATWTDGGDVYVWGEHTGAVPFGALTKAEKENPDLWSRTWTDPATGDTYTREKKAEMTTWGSTSLPSAQKLMRTWTDPATGDTYTYRSNNAYSNTNQVVRFQNYGQGTDEIAYFRLENSRFNYSFAIQAGLSDEQLGAFIWRTSSSGRPSLWEYNAAIGGWVETQYQTVANMINNQGGVVYPPVSHLPQNAVINVADTGKYGEGTDNGIYKIYHDGTKWTYTSSTFPSNAVAPTGNIARRTLATIYTPTGEYVDNQTGNTYTTVETGTYKNITDETTRKTNAWFENRGDGTNEIVYVYVPQNRTEVTSLGYTYEKAKKELTTEQIRTATYRPNTASAGYLYAPYGDNQWKRCTNATACTNTSPSGVVAELPTGTTFKYFDGYVPSTFSGGWYKIYHDGTGWVKAKTSEPPATATLNGGSNPVTVRQLIERNPSDWGLAGAIDGYTFRDPNTGDTYSYEYFDHLYQSGLDDGWRWVRTYASTGDVDDGLISIDESLYDVLYYDGWQQRWVENAGTPTQRYVDADDTIAVDVDPDTMPNQMWIRNIGTPQATAVSRVPNNATAFSDEEWVWVKNKGQAGEEEVDAPSPNAISDYTATQTGWVKNESGFAVVPDNATSSVGIKVYNEWLKEENTTDGTHGAIIEKVGVPSQTSTAQFDMPYSNAAYAVEGGVTDRDLQELTWKNGADTYTYDSDAGTWVKNGSEHVAEPPSTATATLWDTDADATADTGAQGTFTNRQIASLSVTKTVTGEGADRNKDFAFTLSIPAHAGETLSATRAVTGGTSTDIDITLDDSGAYLFTLKHGEILTVTGITGKSAYSVTETPDSAYAASAEIIAGDTEGVTNSAADTGTLSDTALTADTTVEYTNEKKPPHTLRVTKEIRGGAAEPGKDFTFYVHAPTLAGQTLKDASDNPVVFDNAGTASFTLRGGGEFTIKGIEHGTAYTVEEADYSGDGYTTTVDGAGARSTSGVLDTDTLVTTHAFVNTKSEPPATGLFGNSTAGLWLWTWLAVCGIFGGIIAARVAMRRRLQ